MNIKTFAPALFALSTLGLAACGSSDPAADDAKTGWAGIAEKAQAEIREEMATKNLDIGQGIAGLPSASLSPQGDLVLDGKTITLTPAQRERLVDYRTQLAGIAEAGAEVGIQGAAIATVAMKEAAKAAVSGDSASIEARMKDQTDAIKVAAQTLCDRLPALLEAQRAAAELVPEFKPYANLDEKDILECNTDIDGATP
ncbi:MAG: hypothetical protein NT046_07995 [Arenimonas sp.]|nr:hypothetical protein [Arenimonas sp.]